MFLGYYSYRAAEQTKKLKQNLSYRDSSPEISFSKIFVRSKLAKLPLSCRSHDRFELDVKCIFLNVKNIHKLFYETNSWIEWVQFLFRFSDLKVENLS